MPKVSIIVPIYNIELYVRECIESILSQTYQNYELILVDDGSPDRCGEIIDRYRELDDRVVVIHKKNGGLSSARNAGLDVARGEYIWFVDGDDMVKPQTLATVVPLMEQGYQLVVFDYSSFGKDPKCSKKREYTGFISERKEYLLRTDSERLEYLSVTQFGGGVHWEVWNRIYVREIVEKRHLRFADNRVIFAEDLYFNTCYAAHISRILLIPEKLYCYRFREDSLMRRSKGMIFIPEMDKLTYAVWDHYRRSDDCKYLSEHFEPIYFGIQTPNLQRLLQQQYDNDMDPAEVRSFLQGMLTNYDEFSEIITNVYGNKYWRRRLMGNYNLPRCILRSLYIEVLFDMPAPGMRKKIRRMLLSSFFALSSNKKHIKKRNRS